MPAGLDKAPGMAHDGLKAHDGPPSRGKARTRWILDPGNRLIVGIIKKGKLYAIEPDDEGGNVVKRYSLSWIVEPGKGK